MGNDTIAYYFPYGINAESICKHSAVSNFRSVLHQHNLSAVDEDTLLYIAEHVAGQWCKASQQPTPTPEIPCFIVDDEDNLIMEGEDDPYSVVATDNYRAAYSYSGISHQYDLALLQHNLPFILAALQQSSLSLPAVLTAFLYMKCSMLIAYSAAGWEEHDKCNNHYNQLMALTPSLHKGEMSDLEMAIQGVIAELQAKRLLPTHVQEAAAKLEQTIKPKIEKQLISRKAKEAADTRHEPLREAKDRIRTHLYNAASEIVKTQAYIKNKEVLNCTALARRVFWKVLEEAERERYPSYKEAQAEYQKEERTETLQSFIDRSGKPRFTPYKDLSQVISNLFKDDFSLRKRYQDDFPHIVLP